MKTKENTAPASTVPAAPAAEPFAWRGDVGLFPIAPGLSYREFAAQTNPEGFGDGLLGPDDRNRRKDLELPVDPREFVRAELLVFGNGLIEGPECWVNEQPLALRTLAEIASGKDAYPTCSYSVNRSYSLAEVPIPLLRRGLNTVRVARCHAYLQTAVLRLFIAENTGLDVKLTVERTGENYRLQLAGGDLSAVTEAQFFARYNGPDLELTGREVTWQGAINKNPKRPEDYEASSHCGSVEQAPWALTWEPKLVPSGPIQFRARIKTAGGAVVESPGGILEQTHEAIELIIPVRPENFAPWGFHANGANQNKTTECEFRLTGGGYRSLEGRAIKRAVLAVPLYGSVKIQLNNLDEFQVEAPLGGLFVRHVDVPIAPLFSRMNHLKLKPNRQTGCFQAPGPVLYMIYDK